MSQIPGTLDSIQQTLAHLVQGQQAGARKAALAPVPATPAVRATVPTSTPMATWVPPSGAREFFITFGLPSGPGGLCLYGVTAPPKVHSSLFGRSEPKVLGEGQMAFDWDMGGQKTYAREDWLPRVEDQLKVCGTAVKFLAAVAQLPLEILESEESDDTLIPAHPKPVVVL